MIQGAILQISPTSNIDLFIRPAPAPGHLGERGTGLVLELFEALGVHEEGGGALGVGAEDLHRQGGVDDHSILACHAL